MAETYLTTGQASRMLGVCTATLHNWVKRGLVQPGRSPTGRLLWRLSDLERLARRKAKPPHPTEETEP